MSSLVKELGYGNLRCDPRVIYLEIDLDETSSAETLAHHARDIIEARLKGIGAVDDADPLLW